MAQPADEKPPAAPPDNIIWRRDLETALDISSETVRRWLRKKLLPAPDIYPTRQCMGWRRSTLLQRGFDLGG